MSGKTNQKNKQEVKPASQKKPPIPAEAVKMETLATEIELRTSLNEELDELLQKNAKRFFGGCGG